MQKQYKVNSLINVPQVRLIGEDGKQVGVLSRDEALDYALGQGSDLVLIGETAKPPVAKIIDFKKFLYQEQKKEAEARKGQRGGGTKDIRVGSPFAASGDVETRIKKARGFLSDGFNVKVVIKFAGRQMAHPEFGHKIFAQMRESLSDIAKVEREPKFEGKLLVITFSKK